MKRIFVCCDSFKGTLSSYEVNEVVSYELLKKGYECESLPMADGGEGSLDIIHYSLNAKNTIVNTYTADYSPINASYFIHENEAYIDTASASGLVHIKPNNKKPLQLSSYGTGLLFKHAIDNGIKVINFFLGGSATVDGGVGLLYGLVGEPLPISNSLLSFNSEVIKSAVNILKGIKVNLITDVNNPIVGQNGAAEVYGPQKGASSQEVLQLENAMQKWVEYLQLNVSFDIKDIKGAGAAGGIGLPFIALNTCYILKGYEYFRNLLNYSEAINRCDIVITGEGCIDHQTMMGKGPGQLAKEADEKGKLVIGIGGMVKEEPSVFDKVFSTYTGSFNELDIKYNAKERLQMTTKQVAEYLTNC
nr:glycerate kinase [uncultured Carboxylicivirga sp.]